MTANAPSRTYSLFGLTIVSDITLPLPAAAADAAIDVTIGQGPVEVEGEHKWGYAEVAGGTLLSVETVGRFLICGGRHIVVAPAAGASERNIRLFLLGSAFGALLHQRGLMPLHANAVVVDGRAFAFCGHSGAGKSTMAAWFHDRGHPILADDVCVIGFGTDGGAIAYPGVPRLRLWRQALEESGRFVDNYERSFDAVDKYDVPITGEEPTDPAPHAAVYLLAKAEPGVEAGSIHRLTGIDAVETLVSNTYRGAYLASIGGTGPHLAACVRIAKTVPIFRAERRWGFDAFAAEAGRLHDHALSLAQGAR